MAASGNSEVQGSVSPYAGELLALQRAIPVTRMVDYGLPRSEALQFFELAPEDRAWQKLAVRFADGHGEKARALAAQGQLSQAALEFEWAAAGCNVAQLAFNCDVPEKVDLFRRSVSLLNESFSITAEADRIQLAASGGKPLHGWLLAPRNPAGCVVVMGGLSGWSASYLGIARAMTRRGLAVILTELPGQGETRMGSGLFLSSATLGMADAFIGEGLRIAGKVGLMGNSFGGLLAARIAAQDKRISACCINGALPEIPVPEFRTPREQMAAAFGVAESAIGGVLEQLAFRPGDHAISCPTLILEGGADPIIPLHGQRGFLAGNTHAASKVLSWADGEHTLYNHAADRNEVVAAWFLDQFESHGS